VLYFLVYRRFYSLETKPDFTRLDAISGELIPELYSEINYIVRAGISVFTIMVWESLMNVTIY
jgi:hypothetical protein